MYFSVKFKKPKKNPSSLKNLEKTQGSQTKSQEPKIGSENPRSWEKTQGVATLIVISKTSLKCRSVEDE